MRIKQASKNIKYATIAYFLKIILQLVVRLVFVKSLPVEYLGINGLFTNLLAMLSLAELGVAPAIVYSLYQPLATQDSATVKSLMQLFKKAYISIGCIIITAGICMIPWFDIHHVSSSFKKNSFQTYPWQHCASKPFPHAS